MDTIPEFTLPDWMQPHRRALDWGLLLMVILSLLATLPFLARSGLPRETDAELHVFRTAELIYCIQEGALYPRWAPNFWYGYGYPFFNYYGSATYYLAAGFGLLTGSGAVGGTRFVFILGQVIAGVATFAFVRRRWNAFAGIVAGVVYAYSPYVVFIDPHMRGDLAEAFAIDIIPVIFWAFDWVLCTKNGFYSILAAAVLALLIFSHNLMAVIGFLLLVGWLLWLYIFTHNRETYPVYYWRHTWLTLAFGLLLVSFFTLPVLLESNEVQLERLTGPGHFDYQNHFVNVDELLAPAPPLDLTAVNPAFNFNLGVASWVLAAVGCAALLAQVWRGAPPLPAGPGTLKTWQRRLAALRTGQMILIPGGLRDIAYFGAAGTTLIFLMTPASSFIWQTVPYMPIIQFPWRFLGVASFCLAILAGAATRWLRTLPERIQPAALAVLAAAPLFGALTVLYPPEWSPNFGPTNPAAYIEFELSGVAVGTTAGGEFLPKAVVVPPGPERSLIDSYRRPGEIDKVNRATVPEQAIVDVIRHNPTEDIFSVRSSVPFMLRLYTFAFAGWRVEIDGKPVEYEIGAPEGFIVVPVPEGTHQVRVYLGTTPARVLGQALSLAAATGLAAMLYITQKKRTDIPRLLLAGRAIIAIVGVGLLFAVVRLFGIEQFYLRSAPGEPPLPAMYAHHQPYEQGIELLAYDLPRAEIRAGETLPVTLYWHTTQPIEANYQSFVHLVPLGENVPITQVDKLNPGDYPTTRWQPGRYIRDKYELETPDDIAPGRYLIFFGLYDRNTETRLMISGPSPDDKGVLPVFVDVLP